MNENSSPNDDPDLSSPQQQVLELQREVEDLKAELVTRIEQGQADRDAARESIARLTELETALAEAKAEVARAARRLSSARGNNEQLSSQLEQMRTSKVKAQRNYRQARLEANELADELVTAKRKTSRLSKQLEQAKGAIAERDDQLAVLKAASGSQLILQPLVRKWLVSKRDRRNLRLPERVVLAGNGPLSEGDLRATLAAYGRNAVHPADPIADVMIVGRDGWLVDDLEDQIRVRGDDGIRVYSQEMLLAALATNDDPLKSASRKTLMQFADGHPALRYLIESGFEWPKITWRLLREMEEFKPGEFAEQSPINKLGYVVGKTKGLADQRRRGLLADAFKGKLPDVVNWRYMKTWGVPGSRIRLRRMARHIAWLGGLFGGKDTHGIAVEHWSDDLDWMREHLYEPWMRFRWPEIGIK
jgi:hypothetical protein